jgi:hypothetical protein
MHPNLPRTALWTAAVALLLLPVVQADVSDPLGDTPAPFMDIKEIRTENDGASTIDFVMEVADMSATPPSTSLTVTYTVDFCTNDNLYSGSSVCYRLQANPGDGVVVADFARARVQGQDGSFCTFNDALSSFAIERASNDVRWTVNKASLNYTVPPTTACLGATRGGSAMAGASSLTSLSGNTAFGGPSMVSLVADMTGSSSNPVCVGPACVTTTGPTGASFGVTVDVYVAPLHLHACIVVLATCP